MLAPFSFAVALQVLAEGDTCPAAVDVAARVRTILHLAPERQLDEAFLVERRELGLYILLRSPDGSVIGERTLSGQGSCDELAQAAAVVLSAWLSDVHPDFAVELPSPSPPPPPEPPVVPEVARPPAVPEVAPTPTPPVSKPPPVSAPRRLRQLDVALGVGAQLGGGKVGPAAGSLGLRYGAADQGLGVTAFGVVTFSRSDPLGPGSVTWRRWPVGLGPDLRFSTPSVSLELSAGPALGWMRLEGRSFDRTSARSGVTWGGFVHMRILGRLRPLAPFVLGSMQVYPSESSAYVANLQQELSLPTATFVLTFGLVAR